MNRRQEALLREVIRAEIGTQGQINEGVIEDLKKKLSSLGKSLVAKIDSKVSSLRGQVGAAEELTDMILDVEGGAAVISDISKVGNQFVDALGSVEDADIEGSASTKNEVRLRRAAEVMTEMSWALSTPDRQPRLILEFGVVEALGMGAAVIGGVPMILKGMYKLANLFGLKGVGGKLEKAYKAAHHLEEWIVDKIVPDTISYAIYIKWLEAKTPEKVANLKVWQEDPETGVGKTIKGSDRALTKEEYKGSKVKKKLEKGLYVVLLTPWLIKGLIQLGHFVSNLINWVEAGATAVKGVEVADLAGMTADLVKQGLEAGEVTSLGDEAATVMSAAADALDVGAEAV